MSHSVVVIDRAKLPESIIESLRGELWRQSSMEKALAWFFSHQPPLKPEDLIAQDEFSYDLLVPYLNGLYLSYDTS